MAASSRTHTIVAAPVAAPGVLPTATCPMCHTPTSVTQSAIHAGGAWRCLRCGQHWDAGRLAAVAAYDAWMVDQAGSHDAARLPDSPGGLLDGRS